MQHLSHIPSFTVPINKNEHKHHFKQVLVRRHKLMQADGDSTAFVQQLTEGKLNVLQVDKPFTRLINVASKLEKGTRILHANYLG